MTEQNVDLAGGLGRSFTFPGSPMTVKRMGYGAMQLAGPHVFGPPKDRAACVAVLRAALENGVNHIDTSDFYGPHVTNQIIKEALHPYAEDLTIVTKVGAKRGSDGSWILEYGAEFLRESVEGNLRNLGLDSLQVVNLRAPGQGTPTDASIGEAVATLVKMQEEGLIQHIGLSNISQKQYEEGRAIAKVVCVQNYYNVAHREDDGLVDALNAEGVAYVPYFPLGGFSPLQSSTLNEVAAEVEATPMAVALAWLLHRSPNILLIPGTSSVAHLRENLAAATLKLPEEILQRLNEIGSASVAA